MASAVDQLAGKLATVAETTGPAARVARLAPSMLGADGPRTWMVVFQNPAEPRATGGIFGSFAIMCGGNPWDRTSKNTVIPV